MSNRKKWNTASRRLFLVHLRKSGNVTRSAEVAGLARSQLYQIRQKDRTFQSEWEEALEGAMDDLEAELRRRAIDGTEKPVYYAGEECGVIKNYSDALGMFLLKGRRSNIFGNKTENKEVKPDNDEGNTTNRPAREVIEARLAEISSRKKKDC